MVSLVSSERSFWNLENSVLKPAFKRCRNLFQHQLHSQRTMCAQMRRLLVCTAIAPAHSVQDLCKTYYHAFILLRGSKLITFPLLCLGINTLQCLPLETVRGKHKHVYDCGTGSWSRLRTNSKLRKSCTPCSENRISKSIETRF